MKLLEKVGLAATCLAALSLFFFIVLFRDERPQAYFAAARGDTNYIARYLLGGAKIYNPITFYRYGHRSSPLLHVSIEAGQLGTIRWLVGNGANLNSYDSK